MSDVQIDFIEAVKSPSEYANYDYKKFAVVQSGKFLAFIYENNGQFLNLRQREFFKTKEAAAAILVK